MRTRLAVGALLVGLLLGAVVGPAQAQMIPIPVPVTLPQPPAALQPVTRAASPAVLPVCGALYTAILALATAGAIVPGLPVGLPIVPAFGLYTVVGAVNTNIVPTVDSLCLWF